MMRVNSTRHWRRAWRNVIRPSSLVAGMVIAVCLPSQRSNLDSTIFITPGDLMSVPLVAIAGLLVVLRRVSIPRGPAAVFGGMLFVLGLTTLLSQDAIASFPGYIRSVQLWILVPIAVMVSLRSLTDTVVICCALIAASLIEAMVGIWQFLTNSGASIGGRTIRAIGTFGATDVMAMATVVSYGFILSLALAVVTSGYRRAALVSLLSIQVVAVALSLSRGTWIALGAAALAILLLLGRRIAVRALLYGTALVIVLDLGFGFGSQAINSRLGSITESTSRPDRSVGDRYSLWQTASGILRDHPITGVGLKNFAEFRDSYAPLGLSSGSDIDDPSGGYRREPLLSPHNQYLLVLSEQGLMGLLSFCGLLLALVWGSLRAVDFSPDRSDAVFLYLVAVGFLTWLLVDFCYADLGGPTSVLMSVMLGLTARWASNGLGGIRPPSAAISGRGR